MSIANWQAVDAFLDESLGNQPTWLSKVALTNKSAGLPDIAVSAQQGAFLALLVRLIGAKRILEIGTLGGYSTLWMADALKDNAEIITLERDNVHAKCALENFSKAPVNAKILLIEGAARDSLKTLSGPFDLAFIDANKNDNPDYLRAIVPMMRDGGIILVDNIVRGGNIVDASKTDTNTVGARNVLKLAGEMPELRNVSLQLVGAKGWDGMLIAQVCR